MKEASSVVRARTEGMPMGPEQRTRSVFTSFGRCVGLAFGISTQILFLYTVVYLFLFLRYGSDHRFAGWWFVDVLLATGFVIPHSLLLVPSIQKRLKTTMPGGLLGCLHCVTTCVTLLMLFRFWGGSEIAIWRASGWAETILLGLFYASWIALFYSLYLTGLGYQTGLTQWWYWAIQRKPPVRPFVTKGAFRWMRHPVYMSFLGLIWFTPVMTLDHAILTAIWTVYIYAGSYFKDRRLIYFIGRDYVEYGKRVSGLPFIAFGSLHRFPKHL
jgi:protein-S-isoprenylcysteine O-methyltransferase Ste14